VASKENFYAPTEHKANVKLPVLANGKKICFVELFGDGKDAQSKYNHNSYHVNIAILPQICKLLN
jgi:hypothetical protein